MKQIMKRLLPEQIIFKIKGCLLQDVYSADVAKAWVHKRDFFWAAFKALDFNEISGDYVEFGSHGGITFRLAFDQIYRRGIKRHMWAFDSFQGLPGKKSSVDDHPKWIKGSMITGVDTFHGICKRHGIPRTAYTVIQGFYEDTLVGVPCDTPPKDIALAYIDCDMYASTKDLLDFLIPRLKHGMILAFDDYFCWSTNHISGEKKALLEVFNDISLWDLSKYRDIGWAGTSFVIERSENN
jgi:hypothetical protein